MNNKIFKSTSSSLTELIDMVSLLTVKWTLTRKEFSNFYLNDLLFHYKVCMGCGPIKVTRPTLWSPPLIGELKLNIDRATRGKMGTTGICDVLHNSKSEAFIYVF
eukprot:TRINITY_DN37515_c1_g1_i1.p1 TRINITY_DN37515_c1_g1~~TRINITY_DN37515_c1_g1_i1.p1  ORF type:complete len:105 (-),score=4.09 TRINITY_DN37515_c1_g1_i1:595-909(-)